MQKKNVEQSAKKLSLNTETIRSLEASQHVAALMPTLPPGCHSHTH